MVGGYKVIDLRGTEVSGRRTIIPGIYNTIRTSVGKPILVKNFLVSGIKVHATYALVNVIEGSFQLVYKVNPNAISVLDVSVNDGIIYNSFNLGTSAGDSPVSDEDGPSASM